MDDFNLVTAKEAKEKTLITLREKEKEEVSQYYPKICKSISEAIKAGKMSCIVKDIEWKTLPKHIRDKLESLGYIVRGYQEGTIRIPGDLPLEIDWNMPEDKIGFQDT